MIHLALIAALAVQDDKAAEEALARFKVAYRSQSSAARIAAVTDLGRVQHKKTLGMLSALLTADVPKVREAAAKALGTFKDFKAHASMFLLRAMKGPNAKEYDVQAACLQAIGDLDDEAQLHQVHRYFDDKNDKVASAAYEAAGKIRKVASIQLIIDDMEKLEKLSKQDTGGQSNPQKDRAKKVLPSTIKAMQAISGDKWTTVQEWKIWWSRKRGRFEIKD